MRRPSSSAESSLTFTCTTVRRTIYPYTRTIFRLCYIDHLFVETLFLVSVSWASENCVDGSRRRVRRHSITREPRSRRFFVGLSSSRTLRQANFPFPIRILLENRRQNENVVVRRAFIFKLRARDGAPYAISTPTSTILTSSNSPPLFTTSRRSSSPRTSSSSSVPEGRMMHSPQCLYMSSPAP